MSAKIQVIVPVYNAEKTLRKCLDSVLAQEFEDYEVLLCDDASKDRSSEIMEEYAAKDARFCVLYNRENVGASGTRNRMLEQVTAKYVLFLDGDDTIEPKMLETLYRKAEEGNDVVQCRFLYDFESGRSLTPKGVFPKDTALCGKDIAVVYRKMCTGILMNHVCMKLIRADVIGKLRFDESLKTGEDLVFCARLFENVEHYFFLDKVFYHYFRNTGSLTGTGLSSKEKWAANLKAAKAIRESMKARGIKNPGYFMLAFMRIYIITISKIFRTAREKMFT